MTELLIDGILVTTLDTAPPPTSTPIKLAYSAEVPEWGYLGAIQFEYSLSTPQTVLIRTLQYYLRSSSLPERTVFTVRAPDHATLSINPTALNQWTRWDSSLITPRLSNMFCELEFLFQAMPTGSTQVKKRTAALPFN